MKIFIASDHRGHALKNQICRHLQESHLDFYDCGNDHIDFEDDYNDFARIACSAWRREANPDNFGILICGSAQGMCMQANRFPGIRAARCLSVTDAIETRQHNNANFICLSAGNPNVQSSFIDIINAFLTTPSLNGDKYMRRQHKLDRPFLSTDAEIIPTILTDQAQNFDHFCTLYSRFSPCFHLDFLDGSISGTQSTLALDFFYKLKAKPLTYDLHLMSNQPQRYLNEIIQLNPRILILHLSQDAIVKPSAQAQIQDIMSQLQNTTNIQVSYAIEMQTDLKTLTPIIKRLDHAMLFSGKLGHYGGQADLTLLKLIPTLLDINPALTFGWDGGINQDNIRAIQGAGVSQLNVGSYLSQANSPLTNYQNLITALKEQHD